MTIEEKAKAYDEAIEKLRGLHDDYDTVSTLIDIKEELEHIFPELAKSEDEKVRKEIIESMRHQIDRFSDAPNVQKKYEYWIAWLEKQGEKPIGYIHTIDKDGSYTKEPILSNSSNNGKLAWSEEDERMLNSFLHKLEVCDLLSNKEIRWIKNKLKSLRPQSTWKPSESDILLLERIANGKSNPQDFQASLGGLIGQLKKLRE